MNHPFVVAVTSILSVVTCGGSVVIVEVKDMSIADPPEGTVIKIDGMVIFGKISLVLVVIMMGNVRVD